MNEKKVLVADITIGSPDFGGWLIVSQSLRDNASQQYEKTKVPTLFLHGYGSSHRAEEHMTQAIVKAGVTQNVIRATVSKDGTVKLQGALPQSAYNPLVEVEFEDNKNANYRQNGVWLKNVLVKLQKRMALRNLMLLLIRWET